MLLYKYTCAELAAEIISERKTRFTQLNALNDPFESYPPVAGLVTEENLIELTDDLIGDEAILNGVIEQSIEQVYAELPAQVRSIITKERMVAVMFEELGEKLAQEGKTLPDFLRHLMRARVSETVQKTRSTLMATFASAVAILSLSAVRDNEVMWSHYADVHRGVVLGFDSENPFMANVIKVKYQAERPPLSLESRPTDGSAWREGLEFFFGIKNEAWGYEQEYRVTSVLGALTPSGKTDRNGCPIYLGTFSPSALQSVIFGARADSSVQIAISELLKSPDFSHCKKSQEILDPRVLRVTIADLP